MYYYLLLFSFAGYFLKWCTEEFDDDGFVKYIEERHEHTQKIIKRIFKWCDSFRDNTSYSVLNYLDLKIILGVQHGCYNFFKLFNDSRKHYTKNINRLKKIYEDITLEDSLHHITCRWFKAFMKINSVDNLPNVFNQRFNVDLDLFMNEIHSERESQISDSYSLQDCY